MTLSVRWSALKFLYSYLHIWECINVDVFVFLYPQVSTITLQPFLDLLKFGPNVIKQILCQIWVITNSKSEANITLWVYWMRNRGLLLQTLCTLFTQLAILTCCALYWQMTPSPLYLWTIPFNLNASYCQSNIGETGPPPTKVTKSWNLFLNCPISFEIVRTSHW